MHGLGFIGGNIDRAAALRIDEAWLSARHANPGSCFIKFYDDRPLIDVAGGNLSIARFGRDELSDRVEERFPVLIGLDDQDTAWFAVACHLREDNPPTSDSLKLIDLRSLALQGELPDRELGLLAQARSLLFWHEWHRFCANCGAATDMREGGYRRHCAACGADHFPRTDPVVIVVALKDGKCLLGRGANFAEGVYSALAGFMEPGETLEDAARREVLEETGIRLARIDYLLSQPWPFPSSLMIGLIGEALNDDITIDPAEIEDARWFDLAELEAMLAGTHPNGLKTPPVMAIAHHLAREAVRRLKDRSG